MIAKARKWIIHEYNKEKASCFADELGISPLVTGILLERGFSNTDEMKDFLYGASEPFHDPFLLKDMERCVARIEEALAKEEKITVYGDYDVDGITASSLLYIYLKSRGANVNTYIPKRESEGYGLNDDALKNIYEDGTSLVVTVDCGISGIKEVANAPQGLDIIITDHHTVPDELPKAYAIVNHKQKDCPYPFKDLSGVGIAFKLCQALEQKTPGQLPTWTEYTELVALGTVADIVPLLGENREIVRRGLKAMATTKLIGLQALMKAAGCNPDNVNSDNIGFMLAPRLNAVGRLEHAQSAVELLVTKNPVTAEEIADKLNRENAERQEISRKITDSAEAMLAKEKHIDTAVILTDHDLPEHLKWHPGVIGIVASRLVDRYHLPTIIMSVNEEGMAKGSCRSIPALNLYEAIAAESDLLTQFGGHHQAAGLTLPFANVPEFIRRFKEHVKSVLNPDDYIPHQEVDVIVEQGRITEKDLQELSMLEPCGCSNLSPVFAFQNALLKRPRSMGKDRTHLQFDVDKGDNSYRAVMWNGANQIPYLFDASITDIAFSPKLNVWKDTTSVQLYAHNIRQGLALGDMREAVDKKYNLLKAVARTESKISCFASLSARELKGALLEDGLEQYVDVLKFSEIDKTCKTAVIYDMPSLSMKQLVKELKARGVRVIMVLYKRAEGESLLDRLNIECPDREMMANAYRQVMVALGKGNTAKDYLLALPYTCENSLKIMEELGFIISTGDDYKKGEITKRNLEESRLYVKLQSVRSQRQKVYQENMRIGHYDLVRG
ncbi:MAG: single-stranded-DNA-specific exonuclease RecJ [Phascolarctobacterium sp.]|nr:single-stranded-DNA-specific exonuclease RecJ [Phascolarctobacterium sp.]